MCGWVPLCVARRARCVILGLRCMLFSGVMYEDGGRAARRRRSTGQARQLTPWFDTRRKQWLAKRAQEGQCHRLSACIVTACLPEPTAPAWFIAP